MCARIRNFGEPEPSPPPEPAKAAPTRSRRGPRGVREAEPQGPPPNEPSPAEAVPVVVNVRGDYMPRIEELAERLRARGMIIPEKWVGQSLPYISGSIDPEKLDAISREEGVESVQKARIMGFA